MQQRDAGTLIDIHSAALSALSFVKGYTQEQFSLDRKTQLACVYELVVIGEATKRLTTGFRDQHVQIPWKEIAGMRDRLIHGYDRVDMQMVWLVLTRDLPPLVDYVASLLPNESE